MTRRTRFVAGLLALLALTFSFAESVWASTCPPMPDTGSAAAATSTDAPVGMSCLPGAFRSDERSPDEDERPCPFDSPASAQTCAGIASLPAQSSPPLDPPLEGPVSAFTLGTQSDHLPESTLFRPPRA